jgi:hypothetical protein
MNGRKMKLKEKLLRDNNLDEKYCLHHILFELDNCYPIEGIKRIERGPLIIAVPSDLHYLLNGGGGKTIPSDVKTFQHQFMMMQIIIQLYDGFDKLFDYMITFDDFKSYDHYKYWRQDDRN